MFLVVLCVNVEKISNFRCRKVLLCILFEGQKLCSYNALLIR